MVEEIILDLLHQVDLVANAIPGVEEQTCITQRNSSTAINASPIISERGKTEKTGKNGCRGGILGGARRGRRSYLGEVR